MQQLIARLGISMDTMPARVSREQISVCRNLGARHVGCGFGMDTTDTCHALFRSRI